MQALIRVACGMFFCLGSLGSLLGSKANAHQTASCPLSVNITGFQSLSQSRIATLVSFAREHKISFGITQELPGMYDQVNVKMAQGTVRSIVKAILGPHARVASTCVFGVILIGATTAPPHWLCQRVPEFKILKSPVGIVNAELNMQLESSKNPSRKGFAGDIMGDLGPVIGPMDLKGATVRTLLCRLASEWPGTVWMAGAVHGVPGARWSNSFWTLLPPGDGASTSSALMH